MLKDNKLTQIIFRTVYVVLGLIGIIGNLGYFKQSFNSNFYLYYTNLSNYICYGVVLYNLIVGIKEFDNPDYKGYLKLPKFRFMCLIMILVTFLVYNILLAKDNSASDYFLSLQNLIMHLILPIMFTVDWILFSDHKVTVYYPLLSLIMPLIYVALILLRAVILGSNYSGLLYPYFFLNMDKLGLGGVILWVFILVVIFLVIGYSIYLITHIKAIKDFVSNKTKKTCESVD